MRMRRTEFRARAGSSENWLSTVGIHHHIVVHRRGVVFIFKMSGGADTSPSCGIQWILEYTCWRKHTEFMKCSAVDNREFINGLEKYVIAESSLLPKKQCLLKYVQLLTELVDGAFPTFAENDITPLEKALNIVEVIQRYDEDDEISGEVFKRLKHLIRTEAVLVCCRETEFEKAKELIDHLWCDQNSEADGKASLLEIVNSKRRTHVQLRKSTFAGFLNEAKVYLTTIFSMFNKPFLIMANEKFQLKKQEQDLMGKNNGTLTQKRKRMLEQSSLIMEEDPQEVLSAIAQTKKQIVSNVTHKVSRKWERVDCPSRGSRGKAEHVSLGFGGSEDAHASSKIGRSGAEHVSPGSNRRISAHDLSHTGRSSRAEHASSRSSRSGDANASLRSSNSGAEHISPGVSRSGDDAHASESNTCGTEHWSSDSEVFSEVNLTPAKKQKHPPESSSLSRHVFPSSRSFRNTSHRLINIYSEQEGEKIRWSSSDEESTKTGNKLQVVAVRRSLNVKQKRRKWTEEEVEALRNGVKMYGKGAWAKIILNAKLIHRSAVDAKDKWRNLEKLCQT